MNDNEIPTPETDAAVKRFVGLSGDRYLVEADVARSLAAERDKIKADNEEMRAAGFANDRDLQKEFKRVEAERDAAVKAKGQAEHAENELRRQRNEAETREKAALKRAEEAEDELRALRKTEHYQLSETKRELLAAQRRIDVEVTKQIEQRKVSDARIAELEGQRDYLEVDNRRLSKALEVAVGGIIGKIDQALRRGEVMERGHNGKAHEPLADSGRRAERK